MSNERYNYGPGRRLPTYLLWRSASGSTLYSDGAFGIFRSTIATERTRGSICCSIAFDSGSVAYPVMEWIRSDSCATLDTLKSNQSEMFRSRSNYCESNETRTVTIYVNELVVIVNRKSILVQYIGLVRNILRFFRKFPGMAENVLEYSILGVYIDGMNTVRMTIKLSKWKLISN